VKGEIIMYKTPIFFQPYDDETGYCWICRLTKANGLSDMNELIDTFAAPNMTVQRASLKYDLFQHPDYLLDTTPDTLNETVFRFICEHSIFPALAPFMTRPIQDRYINLIFRSKNNSKKDSSKSLIKNPCYCVKCRKEDTLQFGETYTNRIHQLPGVAFCPKHNIRLLTCKNDQPVSSVRKEASALYAAFAKKLVTEWLPCDFYDIRQAIQRRFQKLHYKKLFPFDDFVQAFRQSPLSEYYPTNIAQAIQKLFLNATYPCYEHLIALLAFLFPDMDTLKQCLPKHNNDQEKELTKALSDNSYTQCSPYDPRLIFLRHDTCGTVFFITPHAFLCGWGCPLCDHKLSDSELLERQIKMIGHGHYTLMYTKRSGKMTFCTLHHNVCNSTFSVRTDAFIYGSSRCKCENMYLESDIRDTVESLGPYQLLHYEKTELPLEIKDLHCGHTFFVSWKKFLIHPYCRICFPKERSHESFVDEIKNLVGEEYCLPGYYTAKDTKVEILHNICHRSSKYFPRHFLSGTRCPFCKLHYSKKEFEEEIDFLSHGIYEITGYSNNKATIHNTVHGQTQSFCRQYILQELLRPTPSDVLPLPPDIRALQKNRSRNISQLLLEQIQARYNSEDLIFTADLSRTDFTERQLKYSLKTLLKKKFLMHITTGIYCYYGQSFSDQEVFIQKYLFRNRQAIGYFSGASFAYSIGLIKEAPATQMIVTNQEAWFSWRRKTLGSIFFCLKGSKTPVTNDNHAILALLDFLKNPATCSDYSETETDYILSTYIQEHNITMKNASPYLSSYPFDIQTRFENLIHTREDSI
jgi:hypothetical protein